MFGKSLAINQDMKQGDIIQVHHLESKKPARQGIDAAAFEKVLGKKLVVNKKQFDFLHWEDFVDN